MTKQEKIDKKIAEYKERFNGEELLSPKEIAPIIRTSIGVQANMRSFQTFFLPFRKKGALVYVHIDDLAEYIVMGKCEDLAREHQAQDEPLNASDTYSARPKTQSTRKGVFDLPLPMAFMSDWRDSINFQLELIAEIDKLELSDSIPDFESGGKRPFPID